MQYSVGRLGGAFVDVAGLADPQGSRRATPTAVTLAPGSQADQLPGQGGHRLGIDALVDTGKPDCRDSRSTSLSAIDADQPPQLLTPAPATGASARPRTASDLPELLCRRVRGHRPVLIAPSRATYREITHGITLPPETINPHERLPHRGNPVLPKPPRSNTRTG